MTDCSVTCQTFQGDVLSSFINFYTVAFLACVNRYKWDVYGLFNPWPTYQVRILGPLLRHQVAVDDVS